MIVVEPPAGYTLVNRGAVHCYNGARDDPVLLAHLANYERIPIEIREAFEVPVAEVVATPTGAVIDTRLRQLSIHIGFDAVGVGAEFRPAGVTLNGVIWCRGIEVGPQGAPVLTHEYGHHIDGNYARMWPGATSTTSRLYSEPDIRQIWDDSRATIPDTYARTSPAEWFAEAFAAQIHNMPTLFLQVVGGSLPRAAALRQAFTSRLPMPAFSL